MKKHNFNKIIKIIEINKIQNIILDNRKINLIDINLKKSKNKIIKLNFQTNILKIHSI